LEVLDLIWIIVDGVLLYIEKFSRRLFVLVFKGIVFVTMGLFSRQRTSRQQALPNNGRVQKLKGGALGDKELMLQC